MRTTLTLVGLIGLIGLGLGAVEPPAAIAMGGGNVAFDVRGTLPLFPCEEDCPPADFDGEGAGGGNITFDVDGVTHLAEFTVLLGEVSGSADYTEPGPPLCPLVGFANSPTTGSVTLSGGSTGIIQRVQTRPTLPGGTVSEASFTLDFTYTRVGATPVIEITGGSVTLEYNIPFLGPETRTHTESIVTGVGTGVFVVSPVQAALNCVSPGELPFEIIGDATIVTG